jgi:hypothetical protein
LGAAASVQDFHCNLKVKVADENGESINCEWFAGRMFFAADRSSASSSET